MLYTPTYLHTNTFSYSTLLNFHFLFVLHLRPRERQLVDQVWEARRRRGTKGEVTSTNTYHRAYCHPALCNRTAGVLIDFSSHISFVISGLQGGWLSFSLPHSKCMTHRGQHRHTMAWTLQVWNNPKPQWACCQNTLRLPIINHYLLCIDKWTKVVIRPGL